MQIENLNELRVWLDEKESRFYRRIEVTKCGKWINWLKFNQKPLPCCCKEREEDCIFIESYYELQKLKNVIEKDNLFLCALNSYNKIKQNQKAIFEWIKDNEELGVSILSFEPTIKILLSLEPYKTLGIRIDKKELENIIEFQEIFTTNYYSKEYEKH